MLRLAPILVHFDGQLGDVVDRISNLENVIGDNAVNAVTRMRDALPYTIADRIQRWSKVLVSANAELANIRQTGLSVQLGGPIGTCRDAHIFRPMLAKELGLNDPGGSWHTDRSSIATVGALCTAIATTTAKIGADLTLTAQDGVATARIEGGGSSAMAHKVNPVDAEVLVALG